MGVGGFSRAWKSDYWMVIEPSSLKKILQICQLKNANFKAETKRPNFSFGYEVVCAVYTESSLRQFSSLVTRDLHKT